MEVNFVLSIYFDFIQCTSIQLRYRINLLNEMVCSSLSLSLLGELTRSKVNFLSGLRLPTTYISYICYSSYALTYSASILIKLGSVNLFNWVCNKVLSQG